MSPKTLTFSDSAVKALYEALRGDGEFFTYEHMLYHGGSQWETLTKPDMENGSFAHSHLKPTNSITWDCFFVPNHFGSGDYSGSAVDRANRASFFEEYGEDVEGVYTVYSGYGYETIAIALRHITPEMIATFDALTDYPLMDDETHSRIEMEMEDEDWDSWIASDFQRAVEKALPDETDDDMGYDESAVDWKALYFVRKEKTNTYWHAESGTGGHVDIDRLVAGITWADVQEHPAKKAQEGGDVQA